MATVGRSFAIQGIDGYPVDIEVKMLEGQPSISIIGLGDQAVKEAAEAVNDKDSSEAEEVMQEEEPEETEEVAEQEIEEVPAEEEVQEEPTEEEPAAEPVQEELAKELVQEKPAAEPVQEESAEKEHTEELDISPQVVPGDADFAESIRKEKSWVKETAESDPEPMAAAAPEVQPVSGPKDVEEDGETLDFSAFCVGLGAEFDDVLSTDICLHRGTGYAWNPATDEVIPDEKTRAGYYTLQNLARSGMLRLFDVVIHGEVICYAMYAADEAVRQNVEYYQIASIKKAARVRANKALDYYTLEEPGALVLCPI